MKNVLLTSVALAGLTVGSVAHADSASTGLTDNGLESVSISVFEPQYGNLETFYGNLETFYGNLETFYGNLETFNAQNTPQYGNLETFYGNLETFYGNLETFLTADPKYGNLETFYGNLETFEALNASYGNLETFYGNLETFYGNLETFMNTNPNYGNLETFYGNLETFYGNLETFMSANPNYGNLETFYGNLETFYGNLETFLNNPNPSRREIREFYGNLETFYGNLETFYGNLETFYGNLETFYGNLETFYGDIDTFVGNLHTFVGPLNAYYGNLETFYGNLETFGGDLNSYYGALNPNYGNLETFYGNLETFGGTLDASYGNLETFWQGVEALYGNLETFYGNLETFWGDLGAQYGNLETFWGSLGEYNDATAADYEAVLQQLGAFYNASQEQFAVPVTLYTNQDFWTGFAKDVFDKFGIDPTDASTLATLTASQRAQFYTEWYDGLMLYTGMDRIDHWMGAVNWSPALTQDHDYKSKAVIGLLDFGITDETLLTHDVIYAGGYDTEPGDTHGSSVISLMIAPYDGFGIMGIAPNASVATYNPFDETKTASFEDVETGINALVSQGARIINMSLGVPETVLSEDWSSILANVVADPDSAGTIFVKSAGNDGVAQTTDIDWSSQEALNRLILVGATNIEGLIADWSNTPGDACAIIDGVCLDENMLKNHFIVAPGEFLLVSDGDGGVMRQSGTSFAAPLVSGTAALIHGAWPWWKNHGEETVEVILRSAKDLGDEGVDEVYGWGMLDVEAALSPLDWDNLRFYGSNRRGHLTHGMSAERMRQTYLRSNTLRLEARDAYVVAFERVGDTYRDFRIPLSTNLFGNTSYLRGQAQERRFQRHLYQRFADWATGSSSFGDTHTAAAQIGRDGKWQMNMTARPYAAGMDIRDGHLPFQSDISFQNIESGTTYKIGFGHSASRLGSEKVFGFYSDYDIETGGVNPIVGLASGGTYASAQFALSDRLSVTASVTENSYDHTFIDPLTGLRRGDTVNLSDFSSQAAQVSFGYQLTDAIGLKLDYTQLHEDNSLLGDKGTGLLSLNGGATTDAFTFGSEISLPMQFTFATSATIGKTRQTEFAGGFLSVDDAGLEVSGFAAGLLKEGVFGKQDRFRISLSQPLHVENGDLNFSTLEVVDRETGELGRVTQTWNLDQSDRQLTAEAIYSVPVLSGSGQFMAFTRSGALNDGTNRKEHDVSVGARFVLRY